MNANAPRALLRDDLRTSLTQQLAELLQLDASELDPRQPFLELGADSMMLVSLVSFVKERFGVRLSVRQLFEELNTVESVAEHIAAQAPTASAAPAHAARPVERASPAAAAPRPPAATGAGAGSAPPRPSPSAAASPSQLETLAAQVQALTQELERLRQGPASEARTTPTPAAGAPRPQAPARRERATAFSLYYFGDYQASFDEDKYRLLFEGARFADERGFEALWIPERHFHSFGGFSPNPSVVTAALARETRNVKLRASVVLPLHHPVRVAEEWSVVDNLSGGRVGLAFASGWQANDFVFAPDAWDNRKAVMYDGIETVQHLWRGGQVVAPAGSGVEVPVTLHPMPRQPELPVWLTTLGSEDTYVKAGELGVRVLTNLIGQEPSDLARKIALYRESLERHGFDPETVGGVTVLVHTFLAEDVETARAQARAPFCRYLDSSIGLFQQMTEKDRGRVDFSQLAPEDRRYLLESAYERYSRSRALVGTVDSCLPVVRELVEAGADEIACFVDFGVDAARVVESLPLIDELRRRAQPPRAPQPGRTRRLGLPMMAPIVEPSLAEPVGPAQAVRADCPVALPATGDQRMLWLIGKMGEEGSLAYNSSTSLRLRGNLEVGRLRGAFEAVVARHEALRTTFSPDGETQLVHASLWAPFLEVDLSGHPASEREAELERFFEAESRKSFDFQAPLIRLSLVRLAAEEHVLVLTVHHLVVDGVSVGIVLGELNALYSAAVEGEPCELPECLQFRDFLQWREELSRTGRMEEQERYWQRKLQALPELELPTDRPRPAVQTRAGARAVVRLGAETYARLKRFSEAQRCTYFMTLMAVYTLLLHRLSRQAEVAVGIAFAGRTGPGTDALVGYCSNPFPIRSNVEGAPSVEAYLRQLKTELLEAYDHQDLPFATLIEKVKRPRDPSRSPFFTTCFNWDRYTLPDMAGLEVRFQEQPIHCAEYDLMPNVMEVNGELIMMWDYNRDLFDAATIQRMARQFQALLAATLGGPVTRSVAELPLLGDEERQALLALPNSAEVPFAESMRIHEAFERCAAERPEATAVVCGGASWSYRQLDDAANRVAQTLRELGARGEPVGLSAQASVQAVAAIFGVLKTGGCYVPVDPDLPVGRQESIFTDAGVRLIVADAALGERWSLPGVRVLPLDAELTSFAEPGAPSPRVAGQSTDLVYTIFTSGSTGRPKGVQVEHRGLVNLVEAMRAELGFGAGETVLSVAPYSFDLSVPDLYLPLCSGAKLVMAQSDERWQPRRIAELLEAHQVTFMEATPPTWHMLVDHGWKGAPDRLKVVTGGEATPRKLLEALFRGSKALWNFYGPTEATAWATGKRITEAELRLPEVTIGKPLQNVRAYVLDERGEPVPVGVLGELCLGGVGLARGYLNRPELNAERFREDLHSPRPGGRLYRTGDLARLRPDGEIEFVGRGDNQVKVRGFRIELGEIETHLRQLPGVKDAVASLQTAANGTRQLVAHVMLEQGASKDVLGLREALKATLPDYMVPLALTRVEAFPRTPNGKVDRKALPALDLAVRERAPVPPATELQQKLVRVWTEVLQVPDIGVQDDFFSIGGSSLLLHRLQSAIQEVLDVKVPIKDLFRYPTIQSLEGALLRAAGATPGQPAHQLAPGAVIHSLDVEAL